MMRLLKFAAVLILPFALVFCTGGSPESLINAVQDDDFDGVEHNIRKGVNPDEPVESFNGATALLIAVQEGRVKMIEAMLNQDARQGGDGYRAEALALSLEKGQTDIAALLVKKGVNPDVPLAINNENTALMIAVQKNRIEMIELMLNQDSTYGMEKYRAAALGLALEKEQTDIAKLFISKGVDADVPMAFKDETTALMIAVQKRQVKIVELILNQKVDSAAQNKYRQTAFAAAARQASADIVSLFLGKGYDPNEAAVVAKNDDLADMDKAPVVYYAVEGGHAQIVDLLLNHGIDLVGTVKSYNPDIFQYASNKDNPDILDMLLKNYLKEVESSPQSTNYLVSLVRTAKDRKMRWTVSSHLCNYAWTPGEFDALEGNKTKMKSINDSYSKDKKKYFFRFLNYANDMDGIKQCILMGWSSPKSNYRYTTTALVNRYYEMTRYYYDNHVNPNQKHSELYKSEKASGATTSQVLYSYARKLGDDKFERIFKTHALQWTPLMMAVYEKDRKTITDLITSDPSQINVRCAAGRTAIFVAIDNNDLPVFNQLMENGADINIEDNGQRTPFFYACYYGRSDMVKKIVEKNPKPSPGSKYSSYDAFVATISKNTFASAIGDAYKEQMKDSDIYPMIGSRNDYAVVMDLIEKVKPQ